MLRIRNELRNTTPDKEHPIHIRVTDGRKLNIIARTRETANINHWDFDNNRLLEKVFVFNGTRKIEKRDADARIQIERNKAINARLDALHEKIALEYRTSEDYKNTDWLKEILNPSLSDKLLKEEIIEFLTDYTEKRKSSVSYRTTQKHYTFQGTLVKFKKYLNKSKLFIKDINAYTIQAFVDYYKKEGYADSTTQRSVTFLKSICFAAEADGVILHPSLKRTTATGYKTSFIILSESEIEQVKKLKLSQDYLDNARDWLIISVYCGARISDFMRFTKDWVTHSVKGTFLEYTQKKTGKMVVIPLHKEIVKILDKRNGDFPRAISDAKYNEYIKTVCSKAKLNEKVYGGKMEGKRKKFDYYPKYELVSSHIGRRSFASNYYGKIPTPLLMSCTGHSSEQMFLKYIGQIETEKSVLLAQYFNNL